MCGPDAVRTVFESKASPGINRQPPGCQKVDSRTWLPRCDFVTPCKCPKEAFHACRSNSAPHLGDRRRRGNRTRYPAIRQGRQDGHRAWLRRKRTSGAEPFSDSLADLHERCLAAEESGEVRVGLLRGLTHDGQIGLLREFDASFCRRFDPCSHDRSLRVEEQAIHVKDRRDKHSALGSGWSWEDVPGRQHRRTPLQDGVSVLRPDQASGTPSAFDTLATGTGLLPGHPDPL